MNSVVKGVAMPLDVDGGHVATGVVGALAAWASIWIAKIRRASSWEARWVAAQKSIEENLRHQIEAGQAEKLALLERVGVLERISAADQTEKAELRERLVKLEAGRDERSLQLRQVRLALRLFAKELKNLAPSSLVFDQVRALLNHAYPSSEVPEDILDLLDRIAAAEIGDQ